MGNERSGGGYGGSLRHSKVPELRLGIAVHQQDARDATVIWVGKRGTVCRRTRWGLAHAFRVAHDMDDGRTVGIIILFIIDHRWAVLSLDIPVSIVFSVPACSFPYIVTSSREPTTRSFDGRGGS